MTFLFLCIIWSDKTTYLQKVYSKMDEGREWVCFQDSGDSGESCYESDSDFSDINWFFPITRGDSYECD